MASSTSGQDEPNRSMSLATRAAKMAPKKNSANIQLSGPNTWSITHISGPYLDPVNTNYLQLRSQELENFILYAFRSLRTLYNIDKTPLPNTSLHFTIFQHWNGKWSCWHLFCRYYSHDFMFLRIYQLNFSMVVSISIRLKRPSHGKLKLANPSWRVWTALKQAANTFANCWRQIETCLPTVFMPFTHTNLSLPTRVCQLKFAMWRPLKMSITYAEM